jgi:hypothetical protein
MPIRHLLLVILTYGMETPLFRYANKTEEDPQTVYTTTLITVAATFAALHPAGAGLPGATLGIHGLCRPSRLVAVMFICVAIDAFKCIPFAYLR